MKDSGLISFQQICHRSGNGCACFGIQIPFLIVGEFDLIHGQGQDMELVVQLLSRVQLFVTPWTLARQASLSITNSQILLKLMSIESVMPSNNLILCHPLLHLLSIFPSIRVFSTESVLRIRWLENWSFSFSISHSPGM